jgi:Asp-tRNA(Asn)/Glu-tRNA(Gln) amidotransferase A subunit family amidase
MTVLPLNPARSHRVLAGALLVALAAPPAAARQGPSFPVEETTIAAVHDAMGAGRLTCRALVERYLARIAAYDKTGPAINALVVVNPRALAVADSLDLVRRRDRRMGPLFCVPMIVKDNFETIDLPVTAGSLSLAGYTAPRDAFQVARIREAGAVVLAKSNMAEFAFSPYETVNSILPGYTRNPYALDRVTAGSSGGTAAAVSANLGLAGLGTDTGNSIRGPSAHNALVGIRSTMGLTSRAGVVPLNLAADIAGPMTRTVADAAAVFQVIAGEDPDDPATAPSRGRPAENYSAALRRDGLRGARIGVLVQAYNPAAADSGVLAVFRKALEDLRGAGAVIVDSVRVDSLDAWRRAQTGSCFPFKFDLNAWLARQGDRVPVRTLEAVIRSRRFHPSIETRLNAAQAVDTAPAESGGCRSRDEFRARLREGVLALMDRERLDALVYPTWSHPPRLIGDLNTPHGDNSQLFSPSTGFPAISVPMGYTREGRLPAGLSLLARPFAEATLFRLAYAYEQATNHRRPPPTTPALP